jgi:hypothetical protein
MMWIKHAWRLPCGPVRRAADRRVDAMLGRVGVARAENIPFLRQGATAARAIFVCFGALGPV